MPLPSHDSPLARLRLGFAGPGGCDEPHLSVDGMTPIGPNLSHWPGNRTPPQWKADLSTGIAFRFMRAAADEQAAFLGDVELVVNDHFDTDGFCSLLAILRPDCAAVREELLLAAAATGDFGSWQTWRGFAIDRIIARIAAPESPVHNVFARIVDDGERALRRYEWLIENAESVLDHPGGYRALFADKMATVQEEIENGLRGAVDRRPIAGTGCAVLTSTGPLHRMTLNTLAAAWQVLHVDHGNDGTRYRYHDRTESWFELVTVRTPPRRDLRPLAQRLGELEPAHDGASWCADAPTDPIPELYFGVPAPQEYGQLTRELRPSSLAVDRVMAEFAAFFGTPAPTPAT
ncbi:MAG: hypothetical protein KDC98_15640 [Planctomycetes bacterium]|nr:hypothetical protein [Planctomycetota bacterium]